MTSINSAYMVDSLTNSMLKPAQAAKVDIKPVENQINPNVSRPTASASSILHAKVGQKPATVTGSKGSYLYTADGNKIFDATCGAAVACIGHNDPRVKEAIVKQLDTVEYCYSPFFATEAAEQLAHTLTESTNGEMSQVFIVSSGTLSVSWPVLSTSGQMYFDPYPILISTRNGSDRGCSQISPTILYRAINPSNTTH